MFAATGILIAAAHGPIGDTVAFTKPADGRILYRKRRRLKERAHAKPTCEVFHDLDEYYHHCPQATHDTWNAYASAPGISGYDAFMSQALTATNQGWYVPDIPGEGNGSTPCPIMPGALVPPPPIIIPNPGAKCLVGQARVDIRIGYSGRVEFRYQHSFRDPRFPNPADVTCVILGLWEAAENKHHLRIIGQVGVNKDTGWIETWCFPHQLTLTAFGHYRYFLLDQQFDLPIGKAVAIPQPPDADDGDQEAAHAPFVDLHNGNPVPVAEYDNIYGQVRWNIEKITTQASYRWYQFRFDVQITARPNYIKQPGTLWLRGVYDKINYKYRLNLRGTLKQIIRDHSAVHVGGPPGVFRVVTRVSNPHVVQPRFTLTYKADSIKCRPPIGQYAVFDTTKDPVWDRT